MQETYTMKERFETAPTGAPFDELLKILVEEIQNLETLASEHFPTSNQALPLVKRESGTYSVKITRYSGEQEMGFTIVVEVESKGKPNREEVLSIMESVESAMNRTFDIKS